eukprot:CAMPEP_0118895760 /NCGR_PEP_ID=MMETSP1166-20130328/3958_1 /TAXON_ID=1104430 /ORGANISM="Chrysoreinhardia sp, Strain CCMP3193" /LENGTH=375 /DNA_ID=CAMNT_0006834807 /DNA_START=12 /DNA_END=1139 /DNA_ORIENTATION=+
MQMARRGVFFLVVVSVAAARLTEEIGRHGLPPMVDAETTATDSQVADEWLVSSKLTEEEFLRRHRGQFPLVGGGEEAREGADESLPLLSFDPPPKREGTAQLPVAVNHGMGDSCFNFGMKQITRLIGNALGVYAACIPTGDTRIRDTLNGFLMTMDDNVDVFAAKVRGDAKFAGGFNCVGFSQGNSICRGYIHRYNDPPVRNFLSVHGTVSGVAGFPNCDPAAVPACRDVARLCGELAYTEKTQNLLFQIDYYRDPFRVHSDAYKTHSQLARWNNEGWDFNQTYKDNFVSVQRFIMIKAMQDSMVFPNEGEHWGHYKDDTLTDVLIMQDTDWYQSDLFGLKTVDLQGKLVFNTTAGDHLQFDDDELVWWVTNYFV